MVGTVRSALPRRMFEPSLGLELASVNAPATILADQSPPPAAGVKVAV